MEQLGHRLVVSLDDPLGLLGLLRVEEVDEPTKADADHVGPGPEAAHLLVLHAIPDLEGGEASLGPNVPHLAALVPAGGEQLLAGPVPGQAVDAARLS